MTSFGWLAVRGKPDAMTDRDGTQLADGLVPRARAQTLLSVTDDERSLVI